MKRNIILYLALICAIIFALLFFYKRYNDSIYYYPIKNTNEINVGYSSVVEYIADFNDIRKISGFADNVFVGEIVENLGKAPEMGGSKFPNTNFRVQVLYNIKGKLEGDVTVRQEAGYNENGKLQILGGGEYLEEGKTYLLSIRGDMIMSHPNGSLLLSDNLDKNELKEFIIKNEIIGNFRKAYKNEIYYEGSFKISSGINAYKNLSREEKMNLENVENGFVEIEKVSDEAIYMANVSNQDYGLKGYTKIYIN